MPIYIKVWLDRVLPLLGFRTVASVIGERMDSPPIGVRKAMYYLPEFLAEDDKKQRKELKKPLAKARALHMPFLV